MRLSSIQRFLIVVGVVLVASGAAAWWFVRPIFLSRDSGGAPLQLERATSSLAFQDVTSEAGFHHVHHKPVLDAKLEPIMAWVASVGAAAAAGDFDNDGWTDLYVTNSRKGQPNYLYRNQADGTFSDVAVEAGVAHVNDQSGVSTDCVWGDYDNDGFLDLFVVKWGRDHLFHNNGDGTFAEVTSQAFSDEDGQPGSPWANGCSAVWVDYDGDGLLELYVGNYFAPFDLWHLDHTRIMHDDFEQARNAGRNFLFHNDGAGRVTDVGGELGLDDPGRTLSVGHGDINNDGWPDIYCANDFGTDQAFLNQGDGSFRNVSDQAFGQDTKKGMNVDFGDFDHNGWLDIYVTNITTDEYLKEGNMLWHNDATSAEGVPIFLDIALDTQTHMGGWGWGAKFFDFDNDADLDIISVNGFITAGEGSYWYDLASWTVKDVDVTDARNWPPIDDRSFSGNEATRLWRNDGNFRFTEVAERAGVADRRDGRGVVVFDYDNDGDLDVFIANQGARPALFRNDVGGGGNWLALDLQGAPEARSNRDAIGTRVTVVAGSGKQIRELDGGNSYCGQSDRRIYFGLGQDPLVTQLEIRWPSRQVQVLENVRARQILSIQEPLALPEIASLIPTTRETVRSKQTTTTAAVQLSEKAREAVLSDIEAQIEAAPSDMTLASSYRAQCVNLQEHHRSIEFFERLVIAHPQIPNVRLQLSAAYVDKIPTCGGMAAIVSKGKLARKALDQTDMLVEADDTWWPAVYARAMNHLHWPQALRHSAAAADDFRRCIALQTQGGKAGAHDYYVRAYIGLGDALAKDGDFVGATQAWREGADVFPFNRELKARLALSSRQEANDFVQQVRNLEQQINTDFSFLQKM